MNKEDRIALPFEHSGIIYDSIMVLEDCIIYTLEDSREIKCPRTGGVWMGTIQVSGTCDIPFRVVLNSVNDLLGTNYE